jgi:hypothetical protein
MILNPGSALVGALKDPCLVGELSLADRCYEASGAAFLAGLPPVPGGHSRYSLTHDIAQRLVVPLSQIGVALESIRAGEREAPNAKQLQRE